MEHFTDIEYIACIEKEESHPHIDPKELNSSFDKIIEYMNAQNDKFSLMKLEREIKEIS